MKSLRAKLRKNLFSLATFQKKRSLRHSDGLQHPGNKQQDESGRFDERFYRQYYADITGVPDKASLSEHYALFGREEGRFANADALLRAAEAEHGALPADFVPVAYRSFHADLASLEEDWQLVEHYLRFGRREGRRYLAHQADRFSPDHFRETHPGYAASSDEACRAAWLRAGGDEAKPGTEAAHLQRLGLSLPCFPPAFPWPFYARLYPRTGIHRWSALAHFLREGFADVGSTLPYGAGAQDFLAAVGDHFAHLGSPLALQAYELAAAAGALSVDVQERMAEAYVRAGAWGPAHVVYSGLVRGGSRTPSAWRGLARTTSRVQAWDETFAMLSPALAGGGEADRELARGVAEEFFACRGPAARSFYAQGLRPEGDAVLADAVAGVAAFLSTVGPPPMPRGSEARRMVLIMADGDLPPITRLRLALRGDLLAEAGYDVRSFGLGDLTAFEAALPGAAAAIFFRVPAWPSVIYAIAAARQHGVPTLYETDALTVDPRHAPEPLAAFDGRIGESAHGDLLFGVALYRGAASLCDYGVVPNRALAEHVDRVVSGRRSFIIRETRPARDTAVPMRGRTGVHLFLHAMPVGVLRADVGAALLAALKRHSELRLTVSGYVTLEDAFSPFAARVRQLGATPDDLDRLRGSDLNIVVAPAGEIGECEPISRWLEGALCGVASLASSTRVYREALRDGHDVLLADSAEAWRTGLDRLICEPELRIAIANAARHHAASAFDPRTAVEDCRAMMECLTRAEPA